MAPRLVCLVAVLALLSWTVRAEPEGKPPLPGCEPQRAADIAQWRSWFEGHGPGFPSQDRPGEADRIDKNRSTVLRYLDRLYLARDDGALVVLADCPFGDSMYRYVYRHFDDIGGFYVVLRAGYEDISYSFVSRKTGLIFRFNSIPAWSPDRSRFATGICDALNGVNELHVTRPSGDGFEHETVIPLPCEMGECSFAWGNGSTIEVSCTERSAGRSKSFRVVRRDGLWTAEP